MTNKQREEIVNKKSDEENGYFLRYAAALIPQEEHFKEGFVKVELQRKDIWRECAKEVPTQMGEDVIVLCRNKNKPDGIWLADLIQCWEGKWEPRVNYETPVYWAYLDDILPHFN